MKYFCLEAGGERAARPRNGWDAAAYRRVRDDVVKRFPRLPSDDDDGRMIPRMASPSSV